MTTKTELIEFLKGEIPKKKIPPLAQTKKYHLCRLAFHAAKESRETTGNVWGRVLIHVGKKQVTEKTYKKAESLLMNMLSDAACKKERSERDAIYHEMMPHIRSEPFSNFFYTALSAYGAKTPAGLPTESLKRLHKTIRHFPPPETRKQRLG